MDLQVGSANDSSVSIYFFPHGFSPNNTNSKRKKVNLYSCSIKFMTCRYTKEHKYSAYLNRLILHIL